MTMKTGTTATPAVTAGEKEETEKIPPNDANTPRQFRMVALDLDGTLLNSQHQPSEVTKACLRRLEDQGFVISIATGRAITTVYETVKALNLCQPIPVVCSNGAQGYMCSLAEGPDGERKVEKKPLFSTPVPAVVAQKTIDLAKEMGCISQYYVGEDIFADPREPYDYKVAELYIDLTGSQTQYVKDHFQAAIQKGPPSKQLVLCKVEEQDQMMEAFDRELSKEPILSMGREPILCEVIWEETVAFGDGDNDLEFIQMAGKGIAMSNAADVVKKVADQVIDLNNDEDGVAKTLERLEAEGVLVFSTE
ncbi:Sugar phosphatase YidA [Seminavis robusta]|uniref:Sugar phosphatase YidA n=1 Tax=Seminavis robusta TaxID=568900 RepID=A0A9N8E6R0_9STRA|nr:Sugar phosphatase YidA [Seminavis robusta]|eukprot:Sro603_g173930.1 Sugar phosphatase YidA (307) ;mRNA; f:23011-24014